MRKIYLALLLCLLNGSVLAWTIGPMNYQGRLLDNAGVPVTGSYNFKVRIYDAASGGTLKFSEQHNGIAVSDGVYSFLVSTGTNSTGAWDIALWNTPQLFMEVEVNGETLAPRHLMAAAPYAFQANLALTTNNALALGGVTAGQYQSTLADICKAGKGKWLELVNKCLGIGASFPGPSRVNWSELTASNDFKNLDLSRADISGINFDAGGNYAILDGSTFTQTTYSVAGMNRAHLADTKWDGAIASDSAAYSLDQFTILQNASFKNMDMSKWIFATYPITAGMSAAYLSACPSGLGYHMQCRLMKAAGSNYFLLGPSMNFSSTSALVAIQSGKSYLDIDNNALDDAYLNYAQFTDVTLSANFRNTELEYSDFSRATLVNVSFQNTGFQSVIFVGAHLENTTFTNSQNFNSINFYTAQLNHVRFTDGFVSSGVFDRALLQNVSFNGMLNDTSFTSATLNNVYINQLLSSGPKPFKGTHFEGDLHIADAMNGSQMILFQDASFLGSTLSGDFAGITFAGTIDFKYVTFKHLDLCGTVLPLATAAPHAELATVMWDGPVECSDGTDITAGGTCNLGTRMTNHSAEFLCTPGIP